MRRIALYDCTLRDGTQGEEIAFSVEDKLRIAEKLDALGLHYIEGGWPGSNPKDMQFFEAAKGLKLRQARLAAFGSTRRAGNPVSEDPNIQALIEAKTPVITIFGKSWDFHVYNALRTSLAKNLELIQDSVSHLKGHAEEVIYDAEHFFDGYRANPDYALETLRAAEAGGADCIVLCDTNGGSLPGQIVAGFDAARRAVSLPLGVHTHNDSELAVANTLAAVERGAVHVQGCINGYGERCGNANLISVVADLQLKMGRRCVTPAQLRRFREVSHFVDELANRKPDTHQPFVGNSAFAHKGGVHVQAVLRDARTYEHMDPEVVGNRRRVLVSDLSGRSNVVYKAREFGIDLDTQDPETQQILQELKTLENQGYQFEAAEGSFELLMKKAKGLRKKFFGLVSFRVTVEKLSEDAPARAEATIQVSVDGVLEHTAAEGNGPVDALNNALRKALEKFYPALAEAELIDYKVRILNESAATQATTRVLIESTDRESKWGTVGVSPNIIEASWQALVDSFEYKLQKGPRKSAPRGRSKKGSPGRKA
ncbi:MAG: citramalate synthase [Candidatus Tectomicrobia bacterium]|nr:citramalate synthase [Candidatus Tectomicrobia bacterium]